MREIITLQLGQRSNYLATHFWNIQESYFTYSETELSALDHDVHFRAGIGADGTETFTPRTVIYDLKGGFGALRKYNALYELFDDNPTPRGLWQDGFLPRGEGKTSTQKQPVIEANDYQKNLEKGLATPQLTADQVRYWSDFNRVFYHPRSIVQLNEFEHNSQLMPFEDWSAGQELFHDLDKGFDLLDRDIRPFVEECDQLAGLQIFSGNDDGWGGFSSSYVESLREEFGKTSIWFWGLENGSRATRHTEIRRTASVARGLQVIAPQVSAYVRLSSPPTTVPAYVNLDPSSEWSKSSLLCIAVETMMLPTRLRDGIHRASSLGEFEAILNNTGARNIFDLTAAIVSREGDEASMIEGNKERPTMSTPGRALEIDYSPRGSQNTLGQTSHRFSQVEIRRCIAEEDADDGADDQATCVDIYANNVPFPRLDTWPHTLFGSTGHSLGIRTTLTTNSDTQARLKDMGRTIRRAIDMEAREVLLNDLAELGEAYAEGWQSSSESGGDD